MGGGQAVMHVLRQQSKLRGFVAAQGRSGNPRASIRISNNTFDRQEAVFNLLPISSALRDLNSPAPLRHKPGTKTKQNNKPRPLSTVQDGPKSFDCVLLEIRNGHLSTSAETPLAAVKEREESIFRRTFNTPANHMSETYGHASLRKLRKASGIHWSENVNPITISQQRVR